MVRVTQLSDTHFLAPDAVKGAFDYVITEAFAAVFDHGLAASDSDYVVVTGDVADHGLAVEYEVAAAALSTIPNDVLVCPGNHDYDGPFTAGIGGPNVSIGDSVVLGNWCFVFADSNLEGREQDEAGVWSDTDQRIEGLGKLGDTEVERIIEIANNTKADHVWIWVHHPPGVIGPMYSPPYTQEWKGLLDQCPKIRGLGGGHTHTVEHFEVGGADVVICPSLKLNVDMAAKTLLPPGYRTYEFADDGSFTTECHLMDDERWPRIELPDAALSYLSGEISYQAMMERLGAAGAN